MYNLSFAEGKVLEILKEYPSVSFIKVKIPGEASCKAVNYNYLSGSVNIGDQVILNTTAVRLRLGTGDYHIVILNLTALNRDGLKIPGDDRENLTGDTGLLSPGHIMKLRYTPFQLRTLSAEEEDSP